MRKRIHVSTAATQARDRGAGRGMSPSKVERRDVLVWDGPRREGVLPTGDNRGNWNVTWVPADV